MASTPAELIEDREIGEFDDDRLGHEQIADQLVDLVSSAPTPSNVALYGAWGSGKSGIGNLLRERLKARKGIDFARFDAFKYAENPLRRNFVSVVANELGVTDRRFHDGLYSANSSTDFHVPVAKVLRLIGTFAVVALVCALLATGAISLAAWVQGGDPVAQLLGIGAATLPVSLVPATLLTALIAFAGKAFVVERHVEKADSDEEFESLLNDLVKKAKGERVVIFVDELDRCSSPDVVRTLDAVRTFFGVKGTVFVIAADQQVLEEALTHALEQPTPSDSINPYYSAGSGYLDKVFQYQVSVPPLLPQSVTAFALDLIRHRPGVWATLNREAIASILIPAHVRSPRRVKSLLNTFAMTYRLAVARQASGYLNVEVDDHLDELARLVCLRVEFPLFARDLVVEPNLSQYVRELAELSNGDVEKYWKQHRYVSDPVKEVAQGYALGERPVDRLLIADESEDGETPDDGTRAAVTRVHGQQLIDYLTRTRLIAGPTKALIHLESIGAVFNLPANVAEQFERDGQNGAFSSLRSAFERLDDEQRDAALDLLAQAAHSAIGLEAGNMAMSIMSLAGTSHGISSERAAALTAIVAEIVAGRPEYITANTASGAWKLAAGSTRPEAQPLGSLVLGSELLDTDEAVFAAVVSDADRALAMNSDRLVEVYVDKLIAEPSGIVDLTLAMPTDKQRALLIAAEDALAAKLQSVVANFDAHQKAEEEARATAAAPNRRPAAVVERDETDPPTDPAEVLRELDRLVRGLLGDREAAEAVTGAILRTDDQRARNTAAGYLTELAPISSTTLQSAVLDAVVRYRALNDWASWLDALDPATIVALRDLDNYLEQLVVKIWRDGTANLDDARVAATSTSRLLDHLRPDSLTTFKTSVIRLGKAVEDETEIEVAQQRVALAEVLVDSGLADAASLFARRAERLSETLGLVLDEEAVESALAEFVLEEARTVLADPRATNTSQTDGVIEAVSECGWLSESDKARLVASAATAATGPQREVLSLPDIPTIRSYKAGLSTTAYLRLVSDWLTVTADDFGDVSTFVRAELTAATVTALASAVSTWRERLGASEQYEFLRSYIAKPAVVLAPRPVLIAAGIADVSAADVASLLVDRYRLETSNTDRQRVLDLWEVATVTDETARRRLIKEVLVPMIGQNSQAAYMALGSAVTLAKPVPRGSKKVLGDAIVQAMNNSRDLSGRGLKVLKDLGYPVSGFFKKTVDTRE